VLEHGPRVVPLVRRRSWWIVLGLLWLSAMSLAFAFREGKAQEPPLARGVVDGSFHPVAGRFHPDSTKLSDCKETEMRCLEQGFGNLAYHDGPKAALTLFDRRRAVDKTIRTDCHRIAHMIGSASLAHFHGNVALTYSTGSASCASGYYHGILERAFSRVHSTAGLVHAARTLCRGAHVRRRGFLDYQCTHGLGHGLMIQTGYDLPLALEVCGQLQTRWDEVSCTGGAFMENGSTVYGMRSPWLKTRNPIYPCTVVRARDRASCYLRVTTQILKTNDFDWKNTASRCNAAPARWRRDCFRSYGRDTVNYVGGKTTSIVRLCRLAGAEQGQCLYGAARTIADRDGRATNSARFCQAIHTRAASACFAGMGVVVGLLEPTIKARAHACARLAGSFAGSCTSGAQGEVAPDGRGAWG
jgi:hypothetical protein